MGESKTGSWRTHTPFSTTASTEQPTEQWVQTVRRTSIFPVPVPVLPLSRALAFFNSDRLPAAIPTPTPSPERRRKARRSSVGSARARPRSRPLTKWELESSALALGRSLPGGTFLVSNTRFSGCCLRDRATGSTGRHAQTGDSPGDGFSVRAGHLTGSGPDRLVGRRRSWRQLPVRRQFRQARSPNGATRTPG